MAARESNKAAGKQEVPSNPARVRIRELTYWGKRKNALGNEVDVIKTAYGPGMPQNDPRNRTDLDVESQEYADLVSDFQYGELVMLDDRSYVLYKESGAVVDVDESGNPEMELQEEVLDVGEASVDDLARWIQQEKPTVNDVVQASRGEPDLAEKLLEAENQATDGEPRRGVLEGLSAVISRG